MKIVRVHRLPAVMVTLAVLFFALFLACAARALAAAPAPGWMVTSIAEPTNFAYTSTGLATTPTGSEPYAGFRDQIEELTVKASGGTFTLTAYVNGVESVATAPLACDAPTSSVQSALEGLSTVGAGNVTVTGGDEAACSETNTVPYVVRIDGSLSGVNVEVRASGSSLTGTVKRVTETYVQNGATADRYRMLVTNVGGAASVAGARVTDALPAGLRAVRIEGTRGLYGTGALSCTLSPLACTLPSIPSFETAVVTIDVVPVSITPAVVTNSATVEGGGAATASTNASANDVNSPVSTPFGLNDFSFDVAGEDGAAGTLAGGRPYSVTAVYDANTFINKFNNGGEEEIGYQPVGNPENVVVHLPLGLLGDPLATAERCPEVDATSALSAGCPVGSKVGYVVFETIGSATTGSQHEAEEKASAIINVVPEHGYPAELGISVDSKTILLYANVLHTKSGYELDVVVPGLVRALGVRFASLTLFGDPAKQDGTADPKTPETAFFTNPTDCSGRSLRARIEANSWQEPEDWSNEESTAYPQVTGCSLLAPLFTPSFAIAPSVSAEGAISQAGTSQADEPSAYEAKLRVPQGNELFSETATPELKDATVMLPVGVSVSPGAAQGLEGCAEHGIHGIDIPNDEGLRPDEAGEGEELGEGHPGGNGSPYDDGLSHLAPGHCPEASTLGTVEVITPLLPSPLKGEVYLAQPKCGGEGQPACTEVSATNGELYGLYIEAAGEGVIVKLPGTVAANPSNGQLTATFRENPQLPFSELRLHFNGGGRAPLANPQSCGSFTTVSELEPWSAPETPTVSSESSFDIDWDGHGGSCPASLPFAPSFSAGTLSPPAGSYSPFVLSFSRQDREQDLSGLSVTLPEGLLGKLAGVPLCGPGRASAGTCGASSEIGTVSVLAGSGTDPLSITGGRAYLTTGYEGQPFGLSIVVPAVAGPFNLGNVVVRAAIHINPETAQVTVVSDAFPQVVDGVPVRLRQVNVDIDRAAFTLNATNCASQQVAGTIAGMPVEGGEASASESVSSPYAASGCADLPFGPYLAASTEGAAGPKGGGASLVVKVAQKPGEANIHKVDLTLPKVLPARLTTLQKACAEAQFAANPAGCPEASVIGTATAVTPLLNVALTGPAYLVSHGGAAFPDVEFVLQGEGVKIVLDGKTDIKDGVTYSKFETVPDAPISSFETNLPEGPHSVLASPGGDLCGQDLQMPTTITAQSGTVRTQSTRIAVTGCGKPTLRIAKVKVKTGAVLVSVTTTERGTIKISGKGLKTTTKTLSIGTHQVKESLTKQGKRLRKHHKQVKVTARLSVEKQNVTKTTRVKL